MSKVKALYHIVFCTKERRMTIPLEYLDDVYRFIWKEITSLNCKLIRIGGIQNHVHMLIDLHQSVALSELMKKVKSYSSGWMRTDGRFPLFSGWAGEYYANTISSDNQSQVIEYIKRQKEHHLNIPFECEIKDICNDADLTFDERDLK